MSNFESLNVFQKVRYVGTNVQMVIGVFGIIGNILVLAVFARKPLRKYSYSFYSQVKAIGDIIVLLYTFRNWSTTVFAANLDLIHPIVCSINAFIPNFAAVFGFWILCITSLDRLVTIVYPNRFAFFKKKWFQVLVVLAVSVVSLSVNIILPLNSFLREIILPNRVIRFCSLPPDIVTDHSYIYIANILASILVINNIINFKMIRFIVSSRRNISNSTHVQQRNTSSKDRKFAISTIGLGLSALVCKLPLGIWTLVAIDLKISQDLYLTILNMVITLLTIENATAFYINLVVNSVFKDEFFRMIRLKGLNQNETAVSFSSKSKRTEK